MVKGKEGSSCMPWEKRSAVTHMFGKNGDWAITSRWSFGEIDMIGYVLLSVSNFNTPMSHRILYDWWPHVGAVLSGYGTGLVPQLGQRIAPAQATYTIQIAMSTDILTGVVNITRTEIIKKMLNCGVGN